MRRAVILTDVTAVTVLFATLAARKWRYVTARRPKLSQIHTSIHTPAAWGVVGALLFVYHYLLLASTGFVSFGGGEALVQGD